MGTLSAFTNSTELSLFINFHLSPHSLNVVRCLRRKVSITVKSAAYCLLHPIAMAREELLEASEHRTDKSLEILSHPLLLIVDMQNGFCHPEGSFGKLGIPVHRMMTPVPNINKLRALAHAKKIPVLYLALGWEPDYRDAGILLKRFPILKDMKGFIWDTWDTAIIDEVKPDPSKGEEVLRKTRNTGFWGTDLGKMLENRGVDQLIVAGVGTNVCVESTVRDAFTNGFDCVVVKDACSTDKDEDHEGSLRNMNWFSVLAGTEEVEMAVESWHAAKT